LEQKENLVEVNNLETNADLHAPKKKKTVLIVLIIILGLLVLGLGTYLIINHVASDGSSGNQNTEDDDDNEKDEVIILDINSSIVKNLLYPINKYWLGPEWTYQDVNIPSLGRTNMMLSAFANMNSENYDEYVEAIAGVYVPASEVEASFRQIFGPDADYSDGDVKLPGGHFGCGTIGEFDATKKAYIVLWGCGGDAPFVWQNETKLYKAEQRGDEMHVYFYVQPFGIIWDELGKQTYFLYDRELADNFYDTITLDNGITSYIAKNYTKRVNSRSEIEAIVNSGQTDTYKFTFRKQSDGKFYFYSGKWQ
jgi:hypothetical protein